MNSYGRKGVAFIGAAVLIGLLSVSLLQIGNPYLLVVLSTLQLALIIAGAGLLVVNFMPFARLEALQDAQESQPDMRLLKEFFREDPARKFFEADDRRHAFEQWKARREPEA